MTSRTSENKVRSESAASRPQQTLGTQRAPIDISVFSLTSMSTGTPVSAPVQRSPTSLLTTFKSTVAAEFVNAERCHNFNLQLSSALRVDSLHCGRWRKQLIVPGHVSLNVAHESFRCVVWPANGTLTLHVLIPPGWLAEVREAEVRGLRRRCGELSPALGIWNPQVRDAALKLAEALQVPCAPSRLKADELHLSLAVELIRQYDGAVVQPNNGGQLAACKLRNAVEFLHAHLGDDISLATLATEVDLSPFHFARSFKASVGVPPHQYLAEMRIERARIMLATTKCPITDIAMSLGFDSPSHFSTAFRARVGATPSTFRRRLS